MRRHTERQGAAGDARLLGELAQSGVVAALAAVAAALGQHALAASGVAEQADLAGGQAEEDGARTLDELVRRELQRLLEAGTTPWLPCR